MTQNIRFSCCFLILLVFTTGCFRKDVRTIELEIPKLTSRECSKYVLNALATIEGVTGAEPNLDSQTLSITYNARLTAFKNIEYAIASAGFDVNDTEGRAEGKAKLPETCR